VALVVVVAAAAAEKPRIQFTRAGQAAARAVVLTRADLGTGAWSGGATKPDLSPPPTCPNFHPKQSDLVVVGAADTQWQDAAAHRRVESEAVVMQTARMVQLDWQRTVLSPQTVPCLRSTFAKESTATTRFVSFDPLALPGLSGDLRAFRAVAEVSGSGGTIKVAVDLVLIARGRTEITLTTTTLLANASAVAALETRLAGLLASRAT